MKLIEGIFGKLLIPGNRKFSYYHFSSMINCYPEDKEELAKKLKKNSDGLYTWMIINSKEETEEIEEIFNSHGFNFEIEINKKGPEKRIYTTELNAMMGIREKEYYGNIFIGITEIDRIVQFFKILDLLSQNYNYKTIYLLNNSKPFGEDSCYVLL